MTQGRREPIDLAQMAARLDASGGHLGELREDARRHGEDDRATDAVLPGPVADLLADPSVEAVEVWDDDEGFGWRAFTPGLPPRSMRVVREFEPPAPGTLVMPAGALGPGAEPYTAE